MVRLVKSIVMMLQRLWTKLPVDCKMSFHYRVAGPVKLIGDYYYDFGSFVTVGSTLYWASNREDDDFICCVNAFD